MTLQTSQTESNEKNGIIYCNRNHNSLYNFCYSIPHSEKSVISISNSLSSFWILLA